MANPIDEKFQPNWEGSYTIARVGAAGSYSLNKLDGTPVPRMWNVMHLKRYYHKISFESISINKDHL